MSVSRNGAPADGARSHPTKLSGYFTTRFTKNDQRAAVWQHICEYLTRWISVDGDVLEMGAGRRDFSNAVRARSVTAMDIDAVVAGAAGPGVTAVVGDCTDLSRFDDAAFDCVLASNLLEHLPQPMATRSLAEASKVLRPGGRLILIQPNFRLNPNEYFDGYTRGTIYTDRSWPDFLGASGWNVEPVAPLFLPLSMRSRGSRPTSLAPWYLRSPIKSFAGRMLIAATPAAG